MEARSGEIEGLCCLGRMRRLWRWGWLYIGFIFCRHLTGGIWLKASWMHVTVAWALPNGIHILGCKAVLFLTFLIGGDSHSSPPQTNRVCGNLRMSCRSIGSKHEKRFPGVLGSRLMTLSPFDCRFHSPGLILILLRSKQPVGPASCLTRNVGQGYFFLTWSPFYLSDVRVA